MKMRKAITSITSWGLAAIWAASFTWLIVNMIVG